jgi:hypothetical protein
MPSILRQLLIAILLLTGNVTHAAIQESAGIVKSMDGDVAIERNGQTIKAALNLPLLQGDIIQTGPNGKAGLILEDDTVISLGFNSKIALKSFLFQPNEKQLSFIAKVFNGTITFISGQITKLAPREAKIETPYATIGSRGTQLLIQVD